MQERVRLKPWVPVAMITLTVSTAAICGLVHANKLEKEIKEKREIVFTKPSIEINLESTTDRYGYGCGLPEGYEERLESLLENNPDTEEFVSNYETRYGECDYSPLPATTSPVTGGVPLLMQWDQRWGYKEYGSNCMGFTGCGPTCLAMVASYLLDDPNLTPAYMADYSFDMGYCIPGSGTDWALMSDGATYLGLYAEEIPLEEQSIISSLEAGHPVIAIMGPGEFTSEGHFIVIADYTDGYYTINDPNSYERSVRYWTYDEFYDQVQNLWAYSVG